MDALGTWDDVANTDPTVRASGIALLKGLLTVLGTTSQVTLRVNAGNACNLAQDIEKDRRLTN